MKPDARADSMNARTIEVERSVLGGILVDPALLADAQAAVSRGDFLRHAHQLVFDVMTRLATAGKPIDTVSVLNTLTPKEAEDVGGPSYIGGLLDGVPRGLNVGYHARLVKEFSLLRGLARLGDRLSTAALSGDAEVSTLLEDAERDLFALRDRTATVGVVTPGERASKTHRHIDRILSGWGGLRGVSTGFQSLDADLRGLHPGNLIVLAGRPSMGKSSLAYAIAMSAAKAANSAALFFSLEMAEDELNLREVTMRAGVDSWRLMHGWASETEQRKLAEALEAMQDGGVYVVDAPTITVGQIRSISRRAKQTHGIALIAIDYLQLIDAGQRSRDAENRALELGQMTRALKGIARDLRVPVLVLSQLSRAVESRSDKRPQLSDLRESGSIEADADVVLLICRPAYYRELASKYPEHYVEVSIAKQRNGPTGLVKLAFFREHTRFADYTEDQDKPQERLA